MLHQLKESINAIHIFSLIAVFALSLAATDGTVTETATGAFSGLETLSPETAPQPGTTAEETNSVDLQKGLKAYWRFDDPEVSKGYSLEFDGQDDYLRVPSSDSLDTMRGGFTWSVWFKGRNHSVSWPRILDYGDTTLRSDGPESSFAAWATTNGTRCGYVSPDDTSLGDFDKRWHQAVFSYNETHIKMFMDGKLQDTNQCNGVLNTGYDFWIASDGSDPRYNGSLDDIRIYNRSLSTSEVQNLYNEEYIPRNGLILHQDFNKGPNDCDLTSNEACLKDKSSEDNDGTPQNFDDNDFNTGSGWIDETPLNRPAVKDYSTNSHTGRFYDGNNGKLKNFNPSHENSGWVKGTIDEHALRFDGQDDLISVSNRLIDASNGFSLSLWVKPMDRPPHGGSWYGVAGRQSSLGDPGYSIALGSYSSNCSRWVFNINGTNLAPSSACEELERWDHLVAVYNGKNMLLYQNGELQGSRSKAAVNLSSSSDFEIAGSVANRFDGYIDDLRIYDRYLSKSEVKSLSQGESITKDLVGRWNFEAGDRKTAYDTSFSSKGIFETKSVDVGPDEGSVAANWVTGFKADDPYTISAWYKGEDSGGGLVSLNYNNSPHRGIDLWLQGNEDGEIASHVIHSWSDNALKESSDSSGGMLSASSGRWEHLVATYDGSMKASGISLYVNGEVQPTDTEENSLTNKTVIDPDIPVRIGGRSGSEGEAAQQISGKVEEVRIYNRSLNKREIQRLAFQ